MSQQLFEIAYDDSGWTKAFAQYLDLRKTIDPKKEIRRRAKNIAMRLIRIYAKNAPSKGDISGKVKALKYNVRIRKSVRAKTKNWEQRIKLETALRLRARTFTATGWFPAVEQLGGNPRGVNGNRGPKRGRLIERLGVTDFSETMINDQPGAAHMVDRSGGAVQQAIEQERDDMLKYVMRKQAQVAKKAGLIP